jgi:L-asparaginase
MKIQIISTGGTIEGLDYNQKPSKFLNKEISIEELLSQIKINFEYSIKQVFSKDSRFVNETDREIIAFNVKDSEFEKILITHGTYTMVETAKFIGRLNLNKTVVITGSFILGNKKNTDAYFNLEYAISTLKFLSPGVYVVMNGKIFNWDNVRKNNEENRFEAL